MDKLPNIGDEVWILESDLTIDEYGQPTYKFRRIKKIKCDSDIILKVRETFGVFAFWTEEEAQTQLNKILGVK